MDREQISMISKKRKVDGDTPNLEGEGSSKIVKTQSAAVKFMDNVVYRLYFKGLVSNDDVAVHGGKKTSMAGYGVAICDQKDELLFEMKEPVNDTEGVEVKALIRGLRESFNLGIRKVVIYCDDNELYQNITTGKCKPKQKNVVKQLIKEVQCLKKKFTSSGAILVAPTDIKFAFKLAREAIVSHTSGPDGDGQDGGSSTDSDGGDGDNHDDNPWAYGCGCDNWCVRDPPSESAFLDEYIEYYSL